MDFFTSKGSAGGQVLGLQRKSGKRLIGLFLLFLIMAATCEALAAEPPRLAILPFKMHVDRDLLSLQAGITDMLSSRLSRANEVAVVPRKAVVQAIKATGLPENEADAQAVGKRLQADYVLFGSFTIFGDSVSLHSTMVNVHDKEASLTFVKQGDRMDEVIPEINVLAAQVQGKILGCPVPLEPEPAKTVPGASGRPNPYAHPETLLTADLEDEDEASTSEPPSAVIASGPEKTVSESGGSYPPPETPSTDETRLGKEGAGGWVQYRSAESADMSSGAIWTSEKFKADIQGLALGDVDGDGSMEIVCMDDCRVSVHRFENGRLVRLWEKEAKGRGRCIGVDVGDVNGNGSAEIFVTRVKMPGEGLDSFVLEWDGRDLAPISEGGSWYYRVVAVLGGKQVLLGQERTTETPFAPGVYQLTWQNGRYEPKGLLALPVGATVYGFAQGGVTNDGELVTVAFDSKDHLRVFNQSGGEIWRSSERFGGGMNYVETWLENDDLPDRFFLPQRIYICDLDGDGKDEVVVPSNEGTTGRFFSGLRRFTSSYMSVLSWEPHGLVSVRKTPELSGYISDYAIGDFDNDGKDEVVVAHRSKDGLPIIGRSKSTIVAYEITRTSSVP